MKAIHMNPAEASGSLDLRSRQSIGIHFGRFKLTRKEIDAPREIWCRSRRANLDQNHLTLSEGVTTYIRWEVTRAPAGRTMRHHRA